MEKGKVEVERIGGRTKLVRCFSKYPFKFIVPNKVGPSETDAVWIYLLTYGGGIVSGDSIAYDVSVGDGCTAVLTTQSSTKVYKSVESRCSEQILEASSLLAVIPDPVTCFSTARYSQTQSFRVKAGSSLLLVDWISSGRHETGEKWCFDHYVSTNNMFFEDGQPIFLDKMLLEKHNQCSIASRLRGYQSIAMIVLLGPKLKHIKTKIQEDVRKLMSQQLGLAASGRLPDGKPPSFLASCSVFGSESDGVVVRVASVTTEGIYSFLQHQLAPMEGLLGASPY
ncbi:hypothetical protein M569_05694, partial [Genlisea aurea]